MPVIIATPQSRRKDTVASSPEVGIAVRANAEEETQIIDRLGGVFRAGIPAPTVIATTSAQNTGGTLTPNAYFAYRYCYVAKTAYPLIDQKFAINGSLAPRGNPSPSQALADIKLVTGANDTLRVTVTQSAARADLTHIWIFRTTGHATQAEALNASEAGLMYFMKEVTNVTQSWDDDGSISQGADQIELDNFMAPTAAYVIYRDPYWWMIGNPPLIVLASWVTGTAVITLDAGAGKWFTGRNSQSIILTGITTGGFDGHGGYYLKVLTDTTGELYTDPELTVLGAAIASGGPALVTIQGPPTTLYRSKRRNPMAWGHEVIIGTSKIAEIFAHKVAGGRATAIAVIPAEPILKIDCKFPAKVITYNLQAAANLNDLKGTERTINELYSVSTHHSQFVATLQNGACVLWGFDAENFAIVQSDGISQRPISVAIPKILRQVSADGSKIPLIHGIYDPYTETNCMWIPIDGGGGSVNYMVFQHVPSGSWGFVRDMDVLCSASIPDQTTNRCEILVGTESGLLGQAFAPGVYANWNPAVGRIKGTVLSALDNSITISAADEAAVPFNNTIGMEGNWVLITDANGENEVWARISAVATGTLTLDAMWARDNPIMQGNTFTGIGVGIPLAGYKFYVGLIECSFIKYFDGGSPFYDKQTLELWVHQTELDGGDDTYTKVRHYYELESLATLQFDLNQVTYEGGRLSDVWFTKKDLPSELVRVFGLEFINRGYTPWTFTSAEIKLTPVP